MTFSILTACYFKDEGPIWRLRESCDYYGVKLIPYGVGETFSNWRQAKIDGMRSALESVTEDVVMYVDGQDAWILGGESDILYRWRYRQVVLAAERNPFPATQEAFRRFGRISDLWKYPNCGGIIGTPEDLKDCLDVLIRMDLGGNDQAYWMSAPFQFNLDTRCRLFQCMSDDSVGAGLRWEGSRLVNEHTGTTPKVLHFNGGNKEDRMVPVWDEWKARRG